MLGSILCLCFVAAASAAPTSKFYNFLPHYGNAAPAGPSTQVANDYLPPIPPHFQQGGINAPISMEILFPPRFPGSPAGGAGTGSAYPAQAFIKYSLPKAPGQKSVEIYYPYDFMQREIMPNPLPQIPNIFPFNFQPQAGPQQQQPPRQAAPPQVNDPQQPIQQDQQVPVVQP